MIPVVHGLLLGYTASAYEVIGQLCAGGVGEVYRATGTVLKRQVAVKMLPSQRYFPERVALFQREAGMLVTFPGLEVSAGFRARRRLAAQVRRRWGCLRSSAHASAGPHTRSRVLRGGRA